MSAHTSIGVAEGSRPPSVFVCIMERNRREINVAIMGCGMMGQEHASYMMSYDFVKLKFLVDTSDESIESIMKVVGERQSPTRLVEEELFERASEIDLLVIATPNYLHTPAILRWCKKSITILVEKPVAVSTEQLRALREAKQNEDFVANVWVAMEYRYIPAIQKLIQLLPRVGKLKAVTIRENRYPFLSKVDEWNKDRNKSGDTLVEKCCHFFDLFRLLTKQSLHSCTTKIQRGLLHNQYNYDVAMDNPIIDSAYVLLDFKDTAAAGTGSEAQGDLDGNSIPLASSSTDSEGSGAGAIEIENQHRTFQQATMGCLELCMFAEGSRHQEELIVTGMQGRLEAYLPENKVFLYQRPTDAAWPDKSKPPPAESIREEIFECSDLSTVYPFADDIPNHAGYHYCSTAVEWKYLLDAVQQWKEDPSQNFVPQVSLEDGIAAVEMGISAMSNVHNPVEQENECSMKVVAPSTPGFGGFKGRKATTSVPSASDDAASPRSHDNAF